VRLHNEGCSNCVLARELWFQKGLSALTGCSSLQSRNTQHGTTSSRRSGRRARRNTTASEQIARGRQCFRSLRRCHFAREPLPKCGYCFHSHCCIRLKSALGKGVTQKCRKECRIAQLKTQLARLDSDVGCCRSFLKSARQDGFRAGTLSRSIVTGRGYANKQHPP
jgi:hypothetical protein